MELLESYRSQVNKEEGSQIILKKNTGRPAVYPEVLQSFVPIPLRAALRKLGAAHRHRNTGNAAKIGRQTSTFQALGKVMSETQALQTAWQSHSVEFYFVLIELIQ